VRDLLLLLRVVADDFPRRATAQVLQSPRILWTAIEEELQHTRQSISEGKTIAEPLQGSKIFPGMMVQMVAVGEETGSMEAMLTKIADFYDDEVDAAVAGLTAMLEPVMMVFLGGTVGGLLIAMYLPIFKIAETIG